MDSGSSASDEDTAQFKVVVLGNSAVGKTSLIKFFCDSTFQESYCQTMGVDFYSKRVQLPNQDSDIHLQLWDVGGLQLGSSMLNRYLNGANGVCLVYDVTNSSSFKDLEDWEAAVVKSCGTAPHLRPKMFLVGTKVELLNRTVSAAEHTSFRKNHKLDGSFLVSARSGERVNALFVMVASSMADVTVSQVDLDLVDRVTANIVSAPGELAKADRVAPTHTKVNGSDNDCVMM